MDLIKLAASIIVSISMKSVSLVKAQEFNFLFNIGTASGKTNLYKKIVPNTEALVGYQFDISNNYTIAFSVGVSRVKLDYYDQFINQIYNKRTFVTIPIGFKKHYKSPNKRNSLFFGFGGYYNYCLSDKKEIRSPTGVLRQKESFTGYNAGISGDLGFKSSLSSTSAVSFSIQAQKDIINKYKKGRDKITFEKTFITVIYSKRINKG